MGGLEVDAVVKRYDAVEALRGVSLQVDQGEAFGLLGPNGAGKSTLIQIICTMLPPTAGDVRVNGHSVRTDAQAVRRELGVVFQGSTLDRTMSARDNLWIHGRLYKVPKDILRERIPKFLELANLADRADDNVATYSGGMRRRLEIVRAVIHHPRLLLLDEPTVGLDIQSRRAIWDYIRRMRDELGTTVLLTTHYLDEADALCDRIAIIDQGKIDVTDTPENLKRSLGGDTLDLRIVGHLNGTVDALRSLPNVLSVASPAGDRLRLTLREPQVTVPRVLSVLHEGKIEVEEMQHKPVSLDDVFVSRTGQGTRDRRKKKRGIMQWFENIMGGT